jgi:hypothetical protein
MVFTENTKILLIVGIVLILLYFVYRSDNSADDNYETDNNINTKAPNECFSGSSTTLDNSDDDSDNSSNASSNMSSMPQSFNNNSVGSLQSTTNISNPIQQIPTQQILTQQMPLQQVRPILKDQLVNNSVGQPVQFTNNDFIKTEMSNKYDSLYTSEQNVNNKDVNEDVNEDASSGSVESALDADDISIVNNKMTSKNKAKNGIRGGSLSLDTVKTKEWEKYFNDNNNLISGTQRGENNNFTPSDDGVLGAMSSTQSGSTGATNLSTSDFAQYKSGPGGKKKMKPEDLYNSASFLPKEMNNDWFEVLPEPISVKNRHLINITRPIGINTIGTTLRVANLDLRSAPVVPKVVVSPWLQSTVEPDLNVRPIL